MKRRVNLQGVLCRAISITAHMHLNCKYLCLLNV